MSIITKLLDSIDNLLFSREIRRREVNPGSERRVANGAGIPIDTDDVRYPHGNRDVLFAVTVEVRKDNSSRPRA